MPAQRDPSQTVISVSMGKRLLGMVDSTRMRKLRGVGRAQFIRDAIAEKLASLGITIPDEEVIAPQRGTTLAEDPGPSTAEPLPQRPVKYTAAKKARRKKA